MVWKRGVFPRERQGWGRSEVRVGQGELARGTGWGMVKEEQYRGWRGYPSTHPPNHKFR